MERLKIFLFYRIMLYTKDTIYWKFFFRNISLPNCEKLNWKEDKEEVWSFIIKVRFIEHNLQVLFFLGLKYDFIERNSKKKKKMKWNFFLSWKYRVKRHEIFYEKRKSFLKITADQREGKTYVFSFREKFIDFFIPSNFSIFFHTFFCNKKLIFVKNFSSNHFY